MTNLNYSTKLDSYNEANALQQLLTAADEAMTKTSNMPLNDFNFSEFTVTVNGVQTAFICGAPQIEALYEFIKHIASENLRIVDFNEMKIK